MRMFALRLQCHQVHNIDNTNLEIGEMLSQKINSGQCFERRDIPRASHHHVGLGALIVAGP